jgi:hypothetical protein
LESSEASIGTSVGVLDGAKRPNKGRVGTIVQAYGHPDQLAVATNFEGRMDSPYRDAAGRR